MTEHGTVPGGSALARRLLSLAPQPEILANVVVLLGKITWGCGGGGGTRAEASPQMGCKNDEGWKMKSRGVREGRKRRLPGRLIGGKGKGVQSPNEPCILGGRRWWWRKSLRHGCGTGRAMRGGCGGKCFCNSGRRGIGVGESSRERERKTGHSRRQGQTSKSR